MAISGNRVWGDDGTQITLNGTAFDDAGINAGVAPHTGSTATGDITYTFPASQLLHSMSIEVTQDGARTTNYAVEYRLAGSSTWVAFDAAHRNRFSSGLADLPGEVYLSQRVSAVRLRAAGAGTRKVAYWHIYTVPEIYDLSRDGLYMSDISAPFTWYSESKMKLRSDPTRKKGQLFDNGTIRPGNSATGEFYIHNAADWVAIAPVLSASMVGVPDNQGHHVLFSTDGVDWRSTITLENIAARGYSQKIYFIDNAPSSAQQKFTSVKVVCTPTTWSGPGAPLVSSSARMVATIHKMVSSSASPRTDIWFTTPNGVAAGQTFVAYGRGFAGASWAYYQRGKGWTSITPSSVTTTTHNPGADGGQLTTGASTVIDVEAEAATFVTPNVAAGVIAKYPLRSKLSGGQEDVFHSIQINPALAGDLALPPLTVRSDNIAALRPQGLSSDLGIEQLSSRFSEPRIIITGSDPRAVPDLLANSKSSCKVSMPTDFDDLLRSDIDLNTFGLTRWYPHSTFLLQKTDLGPTRMHWVSMDRSKALSYESTMGIFIDPMTEVETKRGGQHVIAPSMVFSPGAVAKRLEAFSDLSVTGGKKVPNFTMLAVVVVGPDPSPEYREVVTGQPDRLAAVPARLFKTTSSTPNLPTVDLRYENKSVVGTIGRARASTRVASGFPGRRPMIVSISVGSRVAGSKTYPVAWMTSVTTMVNRYWISQREFSRATTGQIGSTEAGDSFHVLDFFCGPRISSTQEDRLINALDGIYGVLG